MLGPVNFRSMDCCLKMLLGMFHEIFFQFFHFVTIRRDRLKMLVSGLSLDAVIRVKSKMLIWNRSHWLLLDFNLLIADLIPFFLYTLSSGVLSDVHFSYYWMR